MKKIIIFYLSFFILPKAFTLPGDSFVKFQNKTKEMIFKIKYSKTNSTTMSNWTKKIGPKGVSDGLKDSIKINTGSMGRDIDKLNIKVYWDENGTGKGVYKGEYEIKFNSNNNIKVERNQTAWVSLRWNSKLQKPSIRYRRAKNNKIVNFSKSFDYTGGFVKFYNKTKELTLQIKYKKTGPFTDYSNWSQKIKPGDLFKVKTKEPIGTSGIKDLFVKVYNSKGNYIGTYYWSQNINIKKDKTTKVYFKYFKNKPVPLLRKIYKPGKKEVDKDYGEESFKIGTVVFHNTSNNYHMLINYKTSEINKWKKILVAPSKSNLPRPTGQHLRAARDIVDMIVFIFSTNNKDEKQLKDVFYFSKNIDISSGKKTDVWFKTISSKNDKILLKRKVKIFGDKKLKEDFSAKDKHSLSENYLKNHKILLDSLFNS